MVPNWISGIMACQGIYRRIPQWLDDAKGKRC